MRKPLSPVAKRASSSKESVPLMTLGESAVKAEEDSKTQPTNQETAGETPIPGRTDEVKGEGSPDKPESKNEVSEPCETPQEVKSRTLHSPKEVVEDGVDTPQGTNESNATPAAQETNAVAVEAATAADPLQEERSAVSSSESPESVTATTVPATNPVAESEKQSVGEAAVPEISAEDAEAAALAKAKAKEEAKQRKRERHEKRKKREERRKEKERRAAEKAAEAVTEEAPGPVGDVPTVEAEIKVGTMDAAAKEPERQKTAPPLPSPPELPPTPVPSSGAVKQDAETESSGGIDVVVAPPKQDKPQKRREKKKVVRPPPPALPSLPPTPPPNDSSDATPKQAKALPPLPTPPPPRDTPKVAIEEEAGGGAGGLPIPEETAAVANV